MAQETHFYKLLVEGKNDMHVILSFCQYYDINENFDIIPCDSIDNVLKELRIRLTIPANNKRIGIIVDADNNISGHWQSIHNILTETDYYNLQAIQLHANGAIVDSHDMYKPRVGVWIMPNNKLPGMLEDFIISLSSDNDPLMKRAGEVLDALEKDGIQNYKKVHKSKARVHTYLAWQDEPGLPLGIAVTKKIFNPESSNAKVLVDWLKRLFL